ncbi:hypothetical protein LOZ66_000565 [Ophidiomyces ophidiicola]|nr:hypothetical protein LOZ66_000565 [Ophidiomyces ophidiicola]
MAEPAPSSRHRHRRQSEPQPAATASSSSSSRLRQHRNSVDRDSLRGLRRRSSAISDTLLEAHQSLRSSTDDIIRPRATSHSDESYWQSAPLALALVPAVGGIFFHNGSAILTDVTLLCLAAVILNWSVRLPWDWYHSAQETTPGSDHGLDAEDSCDSDIPASTIATVDENAAAPESVPNKTNPAAQARQELHLHESLALISCFTFPILGTWLLHAIRSQISRPSEGLVSNYNLTIFLFAAEIRPLSHLLTLVQARTLHLQRVVAESAQQPAREGPDATALLDLAKRLENLEARVGDSPSRAVVDRAVHISRRQELHSQQAMETDITALYRAVRKAEKRLAALAFEVDLRFNDIQARVLGDSVDSAVRAAQQGLFSSSVKRLENLARSALQRSGTASYVECFAWLPSPLLGLDFISG